MTQLPYYRDVWTVGPNKSGYPGAFPDGLLTRVRRRWWGRKRLWLFSGSFKDAEGVTVDIKPELAPSVVANCEALPFPDASYDFVMADPPYSEEEAATLYSLPYFNITRVLNEAERVLAPGGRLLFLHRLVPLCHTALSPGFRALKLEAVVGVFTIGGLSNIRALTVWQKPGKLVSALDAGDAHD